MVFFNVVMVLLFGGFLQCYMGLMFDDNETIEEQLKILKHQENKNASNMILCILSLFVYNFKLRLNP
jgi:hypothetical protein